jgi:hypothetical protein
MQRKEHNTSIIAYGLSLEVRQSSIKCPHLEGRYQKLEKNILSVEIHVSYNFQIIIERQC